MSTLKEIRTSKKMTQRQASEALGISLRSYIIYETDESKKSTAKYRFLVGELEKCVGVDEGHGTLHLSEIRKYCAAVLDGYPVRYAILFGSYAKGEATETSDVDLLISTDVTGLRFFGIAERLRVQLGKRVDLLDFRQLTSNPVLLDEILKSGVRIYEQPKR